MGRHLGVTRSAATVRRDMEILDTELMREASLEKKRVTALSIKTARERLLARLREDGKLLE